MLLTATGAVATGLSPAVRRCIDGTFAAGGGTVTEDGTTGSYKYAMSQADTNGSDISFIFSAATAMPVCVNIVTTAGDPTDSVRFGLTALPNATVSGVGGLLTAPTTANVGLADLSRILGTALTETAGQLAAAFKKWFDVSAPVGTVNSIPNATAGAAGGLFIAGTNAATTVTTSLTTTFTGNLTGSAASVTGAVGSVTGAVGSVTGLTASDVGAIKTQTDKFVFTVANKVDSNVLVINGSTTAAAALAKSTTSICYGTCSGGTTTTAVVSALTNPTSLADVGQLIGRTIIFLGSTGTANVQAQASNITNSTTGATPTITFTAMTTAPANGDLFVVV